MINRKLLWVILIIILAIGLLIIRKQNQDSSRAAEIHKIHDVYVARAFKKCLKEKNYSLKSPSAEEQKICEKIVNEKWDSLKTLNSEE